MDPHVQLYDPGQTRATAPSAEQGCDGRSSKQDQSDADEAGRCPDPVGRPTEASHAGHGGSHTSGAERREHAAQQVRRGDFLKQGPHDRREQSRAASNDDHQDTRQQGCLKQAEPADRQPADGHRAGDHAQPIPEIVLLCPSQPG